MYSNCASDDRRECPDVSSPASHDQLPQRRQPAGILQRTGRLSRRILVEILEAGGTGVGNLVNINQCMVCAEDIADYPPIRLWHLGKHRPASMLSVVALPVRPNIVFEIEAVASD